MVRFFSNPIAIVCLVAALLLLVASVNRVSAITNSFFVANIQGSEESDEPDDMAANIDTELVINANLFGEIEAEYVALESVAEETQLPLVLKGVFAGSEPSSNAALIETEDGKTRLYKIDREIIDGAVLRAVYNEKVVISYRGRNESLAFPVVSMAGIDESAPRVVARSSDANSRRPPPSDLPGPRNKPAEVKQSFDNADTGNANGSDLDNDAPAMEYVPPGMSKRDEIRQRLERLRQGR